MKRYYSPEDKNYYVSKYNNFSGTISEFCTLHDLKEGTFGKWVRANPENKSHSNSRQDPRNFNIVEYNLKDSNKIELHLSNGCKLLFPESVSEDKLLRICFELKGV